MASPSSNVTPLREWGHIWTKQGETDLDVKRLRFPRFMAVSAAYNVSPCSTRLHKRQLVVQEVGGSNPLSHPNFSMPWSVIHRPSRAGSPRSGRRCRARLPSPKGRFLTLDQNWHHFRSRHQASSATSNAAASDRITDQLLKWYKVKD